MNKLKLLIRVLRRIPKLLRDELEADEAKNRFLAVAKMKATACTPSKGLRVVSPQNSTNVQLQDAYEKLMNLNIASVTDEECQAVLDAFDVLRQTRDRS